MSIGEAIRVMLARENKSQTWLANEVSVSRSYMSSLCNDNKNPSWNLISRISKAFDCELWELIKAGGR